MIDFGCGDGRTMAWFSELGCQDVMGVDIAHRRSDILQLPLWKPVPEAWHKDFGFSCDVLEHIPTEMVPACIENMAEATRKAAWIQVAMFEDTAGTTGDWGQLHLTVKPLPWWRHALGRHFKIVHATERKRRATFLCLTRDTHGTD